MGENSNPTTPEMSGDTLIPDRELVNSYLAVHRNAVKLLGENPDQKAVDKIREAEKVFFDPKGDLRDRYKRALLILGGQGGKEQLN